MRVSYKLVYFIVTTLSISACSVKTGVKGPDPVKPQEVQIPKFELPDTSELETSLKAYLVCDKKESEQPTLSLDVMNSPVSIEDTIEMVTYEEVDCDKKVIRTFTGERSGLKQIISVVAPRLGQTVESVSIENALTCKTISMKTVDDKKLGGMTIKNSDGSQTVLPLVDSEAGKSGNLNLQLTHSLAKAAPGLNVLNGNNHVQIKYFGKCLKEEETPAGKKCVSAEELGSQSLLISLKTHYVEKLEEKIQIDSCQKDK